MIMAQKPRLSFWQIWNMSFGFLGIQFGFALQNANVSRIFQTLGADIDSLSILWIAAPVTGLLVQPIIGHYSDNTWSRLGRRRPYFLFGALFASIALLIMPNSPVLWIAVGMLWIMDASINISMEPFRAFVGDMLPDEQRTAGFAMQSFFIGTGAVVASALPWMMSNWLGIENTAVSTILWDMGLLGLFTVFGLMWAAYRAASRLARVYDATDPWLGGLFWGARAGVALLFISVWVKSYFSFHVAYQALFVLILGWLAYWDLRSSRQLERGG